MNPDQVKQIVIQTLNSQMSSYSTARVPFHTHNSVDSQSIYLPSAVFAGYTSDDSSTYAVPLGWSISHQGPGLYLIEHNLGANFTVIPSFTLNNNGLTLPAVPAIQSETNGFYVSWYNSTNAAQADKSFFFTAVAIGTFSNKKQIFTES